LGRVGEGERFSKQKVSKKNGETIRERIITMEAQSKEAKEARKERNCRVAETSFKRGGAKRMDGKKDSGVSLQGLIRALQSTADLLRKRKCLATLRELGKGKP